MRYKLRVAYILVVEFKLRVAYILVVEFQLRVANILVVEFKLRVAYILVVEFKLRVAHILVVKLLEVHWTFQITLYEPHSFITDMFVSHVSVESMKEYWI